MLINTLSVLAVWLELKFNVTVPLLAVVLCTSQNTVFPDDISNTWTITSVPNPWITLIVLAAVDGPVAVAPLLPWITEAKFVTVTALFTSPEVSYINNSSASSGAAPKLVVPLISIPTFTSADSLPDPLIIAPISSLLVDACTVAT